MDCKVFKLIVLHTNRIKVLQLFIRIGEENHTFKSSKETVSATHLNVYYNNTGQEFCLYAFRESAYAYKRAFFNSFLLTTKNDHVVLLYCVRITNCNIGISIRQYFSYPNDTSVFLSHYLYFIRAIPLFQYYCVQ